MEFCGLRMYKIWAGIPSLARYSSSIPKAHYRGWAFWAISGLGSDWYICQNDAFAACENATLLQVEDTWSDFLDGQPRSIVYRQNSPFFFLFSFGFSCKITYNFFAGSSKITTCSPSFTALSFHQISKINLVRLEKERKNL